RTHVIVFGLPQHQQSWFCMQRVRHWPFTHCCPGWVQSVSTEHWDTTRQSGWHTPWSQKSAGLVQFASVVQLAWHVALMHVEFAGQSALNTHCCVGLGLVLQKPFWQVSPVPHCVSMVHAGWHSPP